MMREAPQPPAMQPPAITYPLIEQLGAITTRQLDRVARQREEEGIEAFMARIYVDEDAYAGALEAAE
jgi:hypothetical protein